MRFSTLSVINTESFQMPLYSVNPHNGERIGSWEVHSEEQVRSIITESAHWQNTWAAKPVNIRSDVLRRLAELMHQHSKELSTLMAMEMGKPVRQGRSEIDKCAWCCTWFADHLKELLASRAVTTEARLSEVHFAPLGVWFAIMPWNYPFWQVIRCLVPAAGAGNTVILKHASNVTGCAAKLEELVNQAAGGPLLRVLRVSADRVADVLGYPALSGVSFTGSEAAGRRVAAMAGAHLLPAVLELGGSNAFLVLADADVEAAAREAALARFQNSGQSCIAAKRIIVDRTVSRPFTEAFLAETQRLKTGDPLDESTDLGPLARSAFAEELHNQVKKSLAEGARLVCGGSRSDAYYEPTILIDVSSEMVCMQEEVFGPVAALAVANNLEEMIGISNSTRFGLGVTVFSGDPEYAGSLFSRFEEGAVFVNSLVKSDPRLPFGGIKASGFGRELSLEGIRQFCNIKTLYINN